MADRDKEMVVPHRYSAKILQKSKTGAFPAMHGEIYEKDVLIGTFRRGRTEDNFVPPIEYLFYSIAARNRFDDFADSLSISETIENLL